MGLAAPELAGANLRVPVDPGRRAREGVLQSPNLRVPDTVAEVEIALAIVRGENEQRNDQPFQHFHIVSFLEEMVGTAGGQPQFTGPNRCIDRQETYLSCTFPVG